MPGVPGMPFSAGLGLQHTFSLCRLPVPPFVAQLEQPFAFQSLPLGPHLLRWSKSFDKLRLSPDRPGSCGSLQPSPAGEN